MNKIFSVDPRELKEIQHCLYYQKYLAHGTVGHGLLMLNAKAFEALGFDLNMSNVMTFEGQPIDMQINVEVTVAHNESS